MSKINFQIQESLSIMKDHYKLTGVNLYFRNLLFKRFKCNISYLSKKLEESESIEKIYIKGAVAYKLKNIKDEIC